MHLPDLSLNLWDFKSFRAVGIDGGGSIDVIMKHLLYLTGGEQQCRDYLVGYMAHLVQKPGEKVSTMIHIYGPQGCGKGMFIEDFFIQKVLGEGLGASTDTFNSLFNRFGVEWENRLLVYISETNRQDFKTSYPHLKAFTGSNKRAVERKFVQRYDTINLCRLISSSNDVNALHLPINDRRMGAQLAAVMPHGDCVAYFIRLRNAIDDDRTARAFYDYLMGYDLSGYDPRVTIKTSVLANSSRQFNMKTLDESAICAFLLVYLPFARRVWRDKRLEVESAWVKVPVSFVDSAWGAFKMKHPQLFSPVQKDLITEINRVMVATSFLDNNQTRREAIKVDKTSNTRFPWLRKTPYRAIHFHYDIVISHVNSMLEGQILDSIVETADQLFTANYDSL